MESEVAKVGHSKVQWICKTDRKFSDVNELPKKTDQDRTTEKKSFSNVTNKLTITIFDGKPNKWGPSRANNLTYAVDTKTLPNGPAQSDVFPEINKLKIDAFSVVQKAMENAANKWEDACYVNFKEVQLNENPFFIVRYIDYEPGNTNEFERVGDGYRGVVAAAFFPYDEAAKRIVNCYPMFFAENSNSDAVLLHELGHALGFRHEHIWNYRKLTRMTGERMEAPQEIVDELGTTIGAQSLQNFIDENSIMYYPQFRLKGDRSKDLEFKLSTADQTGAAMIYGMSSKDTKNFQ